MCVCRMSGCLSGCQAVGVVLAIIAIKMGAETFDIQLFTPFQSLGLVLGVLSFGIIASLLKSSKQTYKQTNIDKNIKNIL